MKNKISHSILLLITVLLMGCNDDFLEKSPLGQYATDNFFTDAKGAEAGVNGAYSYLRHWDIVVWPYVMMGDISSDDTYFGNKNNKPGVEMDQFNFTPASFGGAVCDNWYTGNFVLIARANLVINSEPYFEFEESLQKRILAEARFIRGFAYFNLVKAFGGVPIITDVTPELDGEFLTRASEEETWAIAEEDLNYAIENLPEKSEYHESQLGKVTKGAAKAMLARAYLFRNDFANVEKYALEVINSGEYQLHPNYEEVFMLSGENGSGSVFEVQATRSDTGTKLGIDKYSTMQGSQGLGWGISSPTPEFEAAFEADDPRREHTIAYIGDILYDGQTEVKRNSPNHGTMWNQKALLPKYAFDPSVSIGGGGGGANNPVNVRIIRYSDVLLMAAEALNENGNPAQALIYLNMVRERARDGNPTILPDVTTTDKDALRTAIWHERRVELGLEQGRYWDILRQGRAEDLLHAQGITDYEAVKHRYFPIPQTEIDNTEGSIEQNPHY
ncbi:RagB/SusD family nutrient uptake outer membrane protein [Tamlana sp. 2201CG12-4]|uniref:RagB/SusD family nutrient uptake outer membrane protein n=1 Tax=Tamlana sp. 2201CG12-4 TaxID=3112582 RepID=UPI002DB70A46|nr:RagB/SusD family nutrient uptake outer membrane protein [Tamlana sp. 2201CG12-4]MEC3905810.1 RagB/SusD family nutrient uptake outer membrane protein [Tamlana sp. 2201CG12-4]